MSGPTASPQCWPTTQGEFDVAPPYAYSSCVAPRQPERPQHQDVVTFDLLTETAPGTGIFTRQTVLDTLTIGYAKPGTTAAG